MHFMVKSAIEERRERTSRTITTCAQQLADERGLDGFTMDELAVRAGVSRRTLFNYVPGKVDAVLGPEREPDPGHLETFVAGGPTGHLMRDLRDLVVTVLEAKDGEATVADIARIRRLIAADPRLLKSAHDRFVKVSHVLADAIVQREAGRVDEEAARIAARLIIGLFDTTLDALVADPDTSAAEHYARVFDTVVALFRD